MAAEDKSENSTLRKMRKSAPILLLIIGWFLIGWFSRDAFNRVGQPEVMLVQQAVEILQEKYYGELPPTQQLIYGAIRGLLSASGDPYAVFNEPQQAEHTIQGLRGNGGAIGIKAEMQDGQFTITRVSPGSPADRAGVQAGDIVVQVDGWQVKPTSDYMEVMTLIRGPAGSSAQLVIQRGDQTLQFAIPREPVKEVIAQTLDAGIGYLRFDQFTDQTPEAVEQALQELLPASPKGIIIDLRYNGGGLMDATQAVLDLFLDEGVAFYARMKDGRLIPYNTRSGDLAETVPLVVLIGASTYSAPETMAASIADRGRGTLIGETTHGKGAIRETVPLADGSSLQFTVAQWLSPVHQENFEGRGVTPHLLVQQESGSEADTVLDFAAAYLRENR